MLIKNTIESRNFKVQFFAIYQEGIKKKILKNININKKKKISMIDNFTIKNGKKIYNNFKNMKKNRIQYFLLVCDFFNITFFLI